MAEHATKFHKYDTGYDGPPDEEARRLIRLAMAGDQPAMIRDRLNAELLEHYVARGYCSNPRLARAVAAHLRRKIEWRRGVMTENMVLQPLKEAGL